MMPNVKIGNLVLDKPIIQGGMGIGVSRGRLAGAVAKEGGMGVISTAQIGYDSPLFRSKPEVANLQELPFEIKKAKYAADGKGAVAVNICLLYTSMLLFQHDQQNGREPGE